MPESDKVKKTPKPATKSAAGTATKRKKKYASFRKYIYSILKGLDPLKVENDDGTVEVVLNDREVTTESMIILDGLCSRIAATVTREAADLTRAGPRQTLTHREVYAAIRLNYPPELAKGAVEFAEKALGKFERCDA